MIRLRGTVEYEGGRTVDWEAGPAIFAEWELYAHRHGLPLKIEDAPRVLSTLFIAWTALGIEEGFDVWRKTVSGFESDALEVPPTLPEPSTAR